MREADPRDKIVSEMISRYRKAKPGTAYHEAARAIVFDEPWAAEFKRRVVDAPVPGGADG